MASSVNLGNHLDGVVDNLVKAGRYGSRSEVLREGVRLVQEREGRWARFDAEIKKAVADVDAGRTVPVDEAFDQLDAYIETLVSDKAGAKQKKAA